MAAARRPDEPLSFPVAPRELLEQLLRLRQQHRRTALWLSPWNAPHEHPSLNGDCDALTARLLDDSIAFQALHAIAEQRPSLSLAEALLEARTSLNWS